MRLAAEFDRQIAALESQVGSPGNYMFLRPLVSRTIGGEDMSPDNKRRAFRIDMLLAGALVVAGLAVSGLSLVRINAGTTQMAQATPPLQSTPGAETKPSSPPEPTTTGQRPTEIPPQPARPDAGAQKSGAAPALPPAPAEKTAAPIPQK
jgi:hypothetical protein